jgi:signal peptidase I
LLTETEQEEKTEKTGNDQEHRETLPEAIAGFASVFVVGLFIITFVIQHFEIPSGSMKNTLLIGDHVFVDRLTPTGNHGLPAPLLPYRPLRRNEIAVFLHPAEPGVYLVKRIIGVPGDRIHLRDGKVYLNGVLQAEPYVIRDGSQDFYRDNFPSVSPLRYIGVTDTGRRTLGPNIAADDLVVPLNYYFAMGDNRDNSNDSRFWGLVPAENVVGRPLFIAWSLDQTESDFEAKPMGERVAAFLNTAFHFFGKTRWNRVLRLVP